MILQRLSVAVVVHVLTQRPGLDAAAWASIAAALGTLILAFFTWRLARQTGSLARATEEDVRAEWRPVLLGPDPLQVVVQGGSDLAVALMELRNVGRGPALNTRVHVSSVSSVRELVADKMVGTLSSPGSATRFDAPGLLFRDSSGSSQSHLHYTVTATYEDLAGRRLTTVLTYEDSERGSRSAPAHPAQQIAFGLTLVRTHVAGASVGARAAK